MTSSTALTPRDTDYKNPHVQNILYWADLPVEHDDFYRDLAVTIKTAGDNYRTVLLSHARITLEVEDITRSDYVTMTIYAKQKEDQYHGVVIGEDWDDAMEIARERVDSPPRVNYVARVRPAGVMFTSNKKANIKRGNPEELTTTTEEVRGETFMLSTESYREVVEDGLVRGKRFDGGFVRIGLNPDGTPEAFAANYNGDFEHPYGGDQGWFPLHNMRETGCGPIAATNVIYYYAQTNRLLNNLVDEPFPTWEQFTFDATRIYHLYTPQTITIPIPIPPITPSTLLSPIIPVIPTQFINKSFGVWFIDTLANGVVRFARGNNVRMRSHTLSNRGNETARRQSYPGAVQFIKAGLSTNNPVVLLVSFNDYIANSGSEVQMSETHLVTITAMTEIRKVEITRDRRGRIVKRNDLGIADYELRTSDWGLRRHIPSLRQMWESSSQIIETAQGNLLTAVPAALTGLASVSFARFTL